MHWMSDNAAWSKASSTAPRLRRPPNAPCHNDLGAEHLLVGADDTALTGVIDWTDASLTDPTIDLGRLYRDLGPPVGTDIAEQLGLDLAATLPRAAFYGRCALLEDLEYGLTTGDRRYSDAALANLARTFVQGAP